MLTGAYLTTFFILILLFASHLPIYLCVSILFLVGASATSQFIAFAGVTEMNASHRTGVTSGIHNMLCMMSGIVMQPLLGYVLKFFWDGSYLCGVPHYTKDNFQMALIILPVCVGIAVLAIFSVKESYPKES